jgi:hypothetical protein
MTRRSFGSLRGMQLALRFGSTPKPQDPVKMDAWQQEVAASMGKQKPTIPRSASFKTVGNLGSAAALLSDDPQVRSAFRASLGCTGGDQD